MEARDQKQRAAFLLFARETDVLSSSPRREASAWTKGGSHRRCSGPAGRGGCGTGSRLGGARATGGLLLRGPRRAPGGWVVFIRPGHTTQPPRPRCPAHQSQEVDGDAERHSQARSGSTRGCDENKARDAEGASSRHRGMAGQTNQRPGQNPPASRCNVAHLLRVSGPQQEFGNTPASRASTEKGEDTMCESRAAGARDAHRMC